MEYGLSEKVVLLNRVLEDKMKECKMDNSEQKTIWIEVRTKTLEDF